MRPDTTAEQRLRDHIALTYGAGVCPECKVRPKPAGQGCCDTCARRIAIEITREKAAPDRPGIFPEGTP